MSRIQIIIIIINNYKLGNNCEEVIYVDGMMYPAIARKHLSLLRGQYFKNSAFSW